MNQNSMTTAAGCSVPFALGAFGVDAILAALAARDARLPAFVYERLDPITRLPQTTWIGLRVHTEVVASRAGIDAFEVLREQLDDARDHALDSSIFSFIGYPQHAAFEPRVAASAATPDAVFLRPIEFVTIDHRTGTGRSVQLDDAHIDGARFWAEFCEQASAAAASDDGSPTAPVHDWQPAVSVEMYANGVRTLQQRHVGDDIGGVVLSVQMMSPTPSDPLASYRALRSINPSTCMFLLQTDGFALWGATSLSLVEVADRRLIAETDGATVAVPELAEGELFRWHPTPKELYEYDVVADALREDLHNVAAPGTLTFTREREQRVFFRLGHLFAEVQADLADNVDAVDVVRALFPHGATVGHPRAEALGLINELEWAERGPFSGAVGIFGADGSCDVASVTRSMWSTAQGSFAQAGAKVVPASVAQQEYEESIMKTLAVRRSARARVQPSAQKGDTHVG